MPWDTPIGYSSHYQFPKYSLGSNPGADALNENLIEAIDAAIFQNAGVQLLSANNNWDGVNTFDQTIIGSISGNSGTVTIDLDDDSNSDSSFRILFSSTAIGPGQLKVGGDAFFNPFTGRLLLQNLTVANVIIGSISGNAATVTNGLYSSQNYSNPSWLTSLAWSKISSKPSTIAGYGITDSMIWKGELIADPSSPGSGTIYYNSVNDQFKIYTEGEGSWLTFLFSEKSYSNPTWLSSLAETKISFTDVTNGNASATMHGFLPKLANTGTKFLRDDGTWQAAGGGDVSASGNNIFTGTNTFNNDVTFSDDWIRTPEAGTLSSWGGSYALDVSGKNFIELNPGGNRTLIYLTDEGSIDGQIVTIQNISSYDITINEDDNILFAGTITSMVLKQYGSATFRYRQTGNYWICIAAYPGT